MIKRYDWSVGGYPLEETNDGEYVRYDDIAPLLGWLQEKAKEWQEGQEDEPTYADLDLFMAGEELEAKLKEYL